MSLVPEAASSRDGDISTPAPTDGRHVSSWGLIVSLSMGLVSVLGYAGTLLLAHLLAPSSYSVYAAAAAMLTTVGVFAAALIPLPLTAVIRAYPSQSEERRQAAAFAWAVSLVGGLLAALITGSVAALFAAPSVIAAVAVSALVLFMCSPVWGWLYGDLQFVRKAVTIVVEVCVRVVVSTVAVLLGWGAAGALGGFLAGSAIVLVTAPRAVRRDISWHPAVLRQRARWTETGDLALAQLIVYALLGADIVLVAVLAAHGVESAGYQALSTLSKAPVFLVGGMVQVAFPLLRTRHADLDSILTTTLRSCAVLAVASAAVIATAPSELVLLAFPDRYAGSLTLLPVLAVSGLGCAGLTALTSVMLGLRAYRRCQVGLLTSAVLTMTGTVSGWTIAGVRGLAVGAAAGTLVAACALVVAALPLLPPRSPIRALRALLVAAAVVAVLALVNPIPLLWTFSVLVLGVGVLGTLQRSKSPVEGVR